MRFECCAPILRVDDMEASLRFYVGILGFENASWGNGDFTRVSREGAELYLSRGEQGRGEAWAWIGVDDVKAVHQQCTARGATIRLPPTAYPWAVEMHVEDPDGNVLRIGSDPA